MNDLLLYDPLLNDLPPKIYAKKSSQTLTEYTELHERATFLYSGNKFGFLTGSSVNVLYDL